MQFIDTKEMTKELFPKASEALKKEGIEKSIEKGKIEGKIEELLNLLSWTAPEIGKKYEKEIKAVKTESALKKVETKIKKEFTKKNKRKRQSIFLREKQ